MLQSGKKMVTEEQKPLVLQIFMQMSTTYMPVITLNLLYGTTAEVQALHVHKCWLEQKVMRRTEYARRKLSSEAIILQSVELHFRLGHKVSDCPS